MASTCYNTSASSAGKDEACFLFMNPPTYWYNATQAKLGVSSWNKA
jgi:hypothetical protein